MKFFLNLLIFFIGITLPGFFHSSEVQRKIAFEDQRQCLAKSLDIKEDLSSIGNLLRLPDRREKVFGLAEKCKIQLHEKSEKGFHHIDIRHLYYGEYVSERSTIATALLYFILFLPLIILGVWRIFEIRNENKNGN